MTFRWVPDSYVQSLNRAVYLWHTQGQRVMNISFHPLCNPTYRLYAKRPFSYRDSHHIWKHVHDQKSRIRRVCPCRDGSRRHKILLYTSISSFNTSTSLGSTDLSHRMLRLKSTLESVSKVVSGTQAEIISKIARLKSSARQEKREGESRPETTPLKDQSTGSGDLAASPTLVPHPPSATVTSHPDTTPRLPTEAPSVPPQLVQEQREVKKKRSVGQTSKVSGVATSKSSQAQAGDLAAQPESPTASKSTSNQLFHPGSFSVNVGETYNYLSHHINAYFRSSTKAQENQEAKDATDQPSSSIPDQCHQNSDHTPTTVPAKVQTSPATPAPLPAPSPTSPSKKSIGHYLGYSTPTVQAFVGSYIAPLVPRFRAEPKTALPVADNPPSPEDPTSKQKETPEIKEQKAADEKARRLLIQREKIIARVSVDNRTRALVQALHRASDVRLYISRVEDLSYHLLEFPETRLVAVKEMVIPCLLRLRQASDPSLKEAVREALTLVGYIDPVKNRGIRILSIDGGGTRGLVALQTLQKLEELSGKPIYQLFDYICGVSTGSILGVMLGVLNIPLSECEELYKKLSSDVFKQNVIVGTVKMGWSHAFYDSEVWEKVLKEKMGSDLMFETSRNPDCPKVAAVSTVVNKGTPLKAYVFRNYNLPPGVRSHYRGGCQHKMWEAIRASSAAPGYFQEFALGTDLHQDGGLLINNPTALAIHECQCLWPNTRLQCVVSLGTGRFEAPSKNAATYTSLKTKLTNVISSATDTEEVHTMLDALLPPHTYFRFNPYMSEEVALDESRSEKLNLLQVEGMRYLERNEEKLKRAIRTLAQEKSSAQRLVEWVQLKAHMYDGLTGFSKP
ncbi:calcium-independent phospholipase A2-gamma [Astyanax mexicanus]|uniref:calcium-independent phospholipase A2-gamma n=1 Tax=Astyanax mexicanus TaxID=7994 RepID=UPI0020CABF9F|nr:calcium-independent phospholipase A2-gamma [Astyanax mexicanus]